MAPALHEATHSVSLRLCPEPATWHRAALLRGSQEPRGMEAALLGLGWLQQHSRGEEGQGQGHTGDEGPVSSPILLEG